MFMTMIRKCLKNSCWWKIFRVVTSVVMLTSMLVLVLALAPWEESALYVGTELPRFLLYKTIRAFLKCLCSQFRYSLYSTTSCFSCRAFFRRSLVRESLECKVLSLKCNARLATSLRHLAAAPSETRGHVRWLQPTGRNVRPAGLPSVGRWGWLTPIWTPRHPHQHQRCHITNPALDTISVSNIPVWLCHQSWRNPQTTLLTAMIMRARVTWIRMVSMHCHCWEDPWVGAFLSRLLLHCSGHCQFWQQGANVLLQSVACGWLPRGLLLHEHGERPRPASYHHQPSGQQWYNGQWQWSLHDPSHWDISRG